VSQFQNFLSISQFIYLSFLSSSLLPSLPPFLPLEPGPLARLAYIVIFLFVLPFIAGLTGAGYHTKTFLRWDLANFLPHLASNHNPPNLDFPSS
jgi:hypothetical protein